MERPKPAEDTVFARELEYHEKLYSGFAQQHFAKPAVRALREHMAGRITEVCGFGSESAILSLGCRIGDTEILLARHVGRVRGVDLSPAALRQARLDDREAGIANATYGRAAPLLANRLPRHPVAG